MSINLHTANNYNAMQQRRDACKERAVDIQEKTAAQVAVRARFFHIGPCSDFVAVVLVR